MWLKIILVALFARIETSLGVGEISTQKCEEYSKAVYSRQPSPVLLPNAGQNSVSECGIVEVPLIIGGANAQEKEFPHMAEIGFGMSANAELSWQCGGALISEVFVLTAAHCATSRDKGPAQRVKLGVININSRDNLQEVMVSARIAHPQYKPPLKYNDIALLRLGDTVQFTPFVRPACLNTNVNFPNSKALATGFGKLAYEAISGSSALMKVQLSLIPNAQCAQSFTSGPETLSLPQGVVDSMMCAGELAGGKDTCQGDSGGPLQTVLQKPYCMYNLIGVTSFGKFCGFSDSPAIYTRVSHYLDWIESTVWH